MPYKIEAQRKFFHAYKKKLEKQGIDGNPEKSEQAVDLIYVHDSEIGIKRIKKRNHFTYIKQETKVKDKEMKSVLTIIKLI